MIAIESLVKNNDVIDQLTVLNELKRLNILVFNLIYKMLSIIRIQYI